MSIATLTCHSVTNPLNLQLATLTAPNHADYCRRHGFTQQILRMDWEPSILGFLKALKRLLPDFDMVLTHGSDVLFMNQSIHPEEVCRKASHGRGVMFALEGHTDWPVNNDVGLWRNDEFSMRVIDRLIADYELWRDLPWLWQNWIWNLLQTNATIKECVTLTNPRMMNASPGGDNHARWKVGDWLCHLLGFDEASKIPIARAMLSKVSADGCYHAPSAVYNRIKRQSKRNPKAVFIGIPSYTGEWRGATAVGLAHFLLWARDAMPDWQFVTGDLAGSPVPKMRDYLVHQALTLVNPHSRQTDFGTILFLDSDQGFNLDQIRRMVFNLIPVAQGGGGKAVIGGRYPAKTPNELVWVENPRPGSPVDRHGHQQVIGIGTGFKAYDLCVFEAYRELMPHLSYVCTDKDPRFIGQRMHLFFREEVRNDNRIPEDFWFDLMIQEIVGVPVWKDTGVKVEHFGMTGFLALHNGGTK